MNEFEWDPEQYEKFKRDRTLPAYDLARAIPAHKVGTAIDIGCGTGNSTAALRDRFPGARIIGADNSGSMLETARKAVPDAEFIKLDAGKELGMLDEKFDVVFSNACIQWIPGHKELLKNMMGLLNKGGVLAVQTPLQTIHPMHNLIAKVARSEKWAEKIQLQRIFYNLTEEEYFDTLSELSDDLRIWEITYLHIMPSHNSIVEWYKGTGMRPYLDRLSDEEEKAEFETDVLEETKKIYPVQKNGEIIFRFPRLFFTARA